MPRPPDLPPIRDRLPRYPALLLALVSVLVVAVVGLAGGTAVYPSPVGLLALNVLFLGLIPISIAYVSLDSFRRGGLVSLLLMGAGMLCIGLGAIAAGTVGLLPAPSNLVITVHNFTVCAGAALQAAAALVALVGWRIGEAVRRRRAAVLAYALVVAAVAVLVAAVLAGLTPAFFVPGAGPTVLRTLVLAGAVALFAVASALFLVLYRRRAEEFFLWYALGLLLSAVGLVAVSFYAAFDDPLSWAGRAEQYLGACFLLGAFVLLRRQAASGGVAASEILASFFAEAEAGYRDLLETAGDAIVVLGPDDRVLLFNASAGRLFGRPSAEAVGMPFADLVPGALPLAGGGDGLPVRRELEVRRPDGTVVPVDLTASRRLVEERPVTTCILHDLSARKRAEAALAESEQRFRLALANAPVTVSVMDRDLRYVWSYGLRTVPAAAVVGRSDAEIFTPAEAARLTAIKERVLAEGVEVREQLWLDRPGGPVYLDCYFEPVRDEAGRVTGVGIATVDLTSRKEAEEAMAASEARYRELFESMVEGFALHEVVLDDGAPVDYRFLAANPAFEAMTGLSADAIVGRTALEVLPSLEPEWVERYGRVATTGEPVRFESYSASLDRWYDVFAFSPGPGRFATIFSDVTDRRQAERRLAEYTERLRASNEELQRFAYVASHDLQEPLRSIVSFSQLLERRYRGRLDADADEYIDFIVEGGTRMQRLIQDLLAYSRVNTTKQELAPTDTAAVLASVDRSLAGTLCEAGATITHDPMPMVLADPLQLEQVFMNLVSNAVKFRRPDVPLRIHVGARRTDDMWEFSVADNGIGIEPEYFEKIFVIFQRLHTKDRYPGTGIGLAIVKRIIDRHGGTVRVESAPGEGTTFFFTLPAANGSAEPYQ